LLTDIEKTNKYIFTDKSYARLYHDNKIIFINHKRSLYYIYKKFLKILISLIIDD